MKKIFILSILLGLFGIVNATQMSIAFNEEKLQLLSRHEVEKLQEIVTELKNNADVALVIKELKAQFELEENETSLSCVIIPLLIGVGILMPWMLGFGLFDSYLCGNQSEIVQPCA